LGRLSIPIQKSSVRRGRIVGEYKMGSGVARRDEDTHGFLKVRGMEKIDRVRGILLAAFLVAFSIAMPACVPGL